MVSDHRAGHQVPWHSLVELAGRKTAFGTATMYVIDFGTHNEGHARLKLYDVRRHNGTRYFKKLRIRGARTENGVWNWCFSIGEWQSACPG